MHIKTVWKVWLGLEAKLSTLEWKRDGPPPKGIKLLWEDWREVASQAKTTDVHYMPQSPSLTTSWAQATKVLSF